MARVLSFSDFVNTGEKFTPHSIIPIPELAGPDGTAPVIYLVSPAAGSVLDMGAKGALKKAKVGDEPVDTEVESAAASSKVMVDLIIECARGEGGVKLFDTEEQVRAVPVFVFNRLVKGLNALMSVAVSDEAGKD